MLFLLVQILYWLALSTWFGCVLFILVAAPVVLRTVRESNPILPTVLSVNLEGQHGTLLGGTIVANLLSALLRIQLACAAGLLLALVAQWITIDPTRYWLEHLVRSALYLAAVALLVYDWRRVGPEMMRYRQTYIDHADEPDVANPANEHFNAYQRERQTLLMVLVGVLLAMVLFSARIVPAARLQSMEALSAVTP